MSLRACRCKKPAISPNPRNHRRCNRCTGYISDSAEITVLACGKCHHYFNTQEAGFAGVSLIPEGGWGSEDFKQFHLCPSCRDALRSWLGVKPEELDPELLEIAERGR